MGGKSSPPPPTPIPPPPDPNQTIAPMIALMEQMVGQFMASQQQLLAQLTLPPLPALNLPSTPDWEADREKIKQRLEQNPSDERRQRGRSSTVLTSPLEQDEVDLLTPVATPNA